MSCDICGRNNCCPSFHSIEEQDRYEDVVDAFERARNLREKVRAEIEAEGVEDL